MEFFTPEEIAGQFRIHVESVRKLIRRKSLQAVKIGGAWRITDAQRDAYVESRSTPVKLKKQKA